MPIKVTCPNCGKELTLPDDLLGKQDVCPRCNVSFCVSSPIGSGARVPPTPQGAGLVKETPRTSSSSVLVLAEGPPPPIQTPAIATPRVPPQPIQTPAVMSPRVPPPPIQTPAVMSPRVPPQPIQTPAVATPRVPPPPIQTPAALPPRSDAQDGLSGAVRRGLTAGPPKIKRRAPPLDRRAETAKFITAETADTRIPLGSNGQLPRLILQDGQPKPLVDAPARSSNLFVLVGVLCLSVTLSIVMLFMDVESTSSDSKTKQDARDRITLHYLGLPPTIKPYQKKLREALQAHNNENHNKESRLYREVLNMMRDETKRRSNAGLTGQREAKKPNDISDQDLEQQLSTLLGNDLSRD